SACLEGVDDEFGGAKSLPTVGTGNPDINNLFFVVQFADTVYDLAIKDIPALLGSFAKLRNFPLAHPGVVFKKQCVGGGVVRVVAHVADKRDDGPRSACGIAAQLRRQGGRVEVVLL